MPFVHLPILSLLNMEETILVGFQSRILPFVRPLHLVETTWLILNLQFRNVVLTFFSCGWAFAMIPQRMRFRFLTRSCSYQRVKPLQWCCRAGLQSIPYVRKPGKSSRAEQIILVYSKRASANTSPNCCGGFWLSKIRVSLAKPFPQPGGSVCCV